MVVWKGEGGREGGVEVVMMMMPNYFDSYLERAGGDVADLVSVVDVPCRQWQQGLLW